MTTNPVHRVRVGTRTVHRAVQLEDGTLNSPCGATTRARRQGTQIVIVDDLAPFITCKRCAFEAAWHAYLSELGEGEQPTEAGFATYRAAHPLMR